MECGKSSDNGKNHHAKRKTSLPVGSYLLKLSTIMLVCSQEFPLTLF